MNAVTLEHIIKHLVLATSATERAANVLLKKYGLTAQGFTILATVVAYGRAPTPSDIQKVLGVSLASITQRLNHLEKLDLIVRKPIAADGRQVAIRATAKGLRICKKGWEESARLQAHMRKDFSEKEAQEFLAMLQKYYRSAAAFERTLR